MNYTTNYTNSTNNNTIYNRIQIINNIYMLLPVGVENKKGDIYKVPLLTNLYHFRISIFYKIYIKKQKAWSGNRSHHDPLSKRLEFHMNRFPGILALMNITPQSSTGTIPLLSYLSSLWSLTLHNLFINLYKFTTSRTTDVKHYTFSFPFIFAFITFCHYYHHY